MVLTRKPIEVMVFYITGITDRLAQRQNLKNSYNKVTRKLQATHFQDLDG